MALIRVTRGVPRYNIQIGPFKDALGFNPSAIVSVSDYFEPSLVQYPNFNWVPINEGAKSWGYQPFFVTKKLLDFYVLDLGLPLVYVCCSAGKHRSPLAVFCWLMSIGIDAEVANAEFYGAFKESPLKMYHDDLRCGYMPQDLAQFYALMKQFPGANYHDLLQSMDHYENIRYDTNEAPIVRF